MSISQAASGEYSVRPVGVIAAPPIRDPYVRARQLFEGKLVYGEDFRKPIRPSGGFTIHCAKTHWIGMVFLVLRPDDQRSQLRGDHIRHVWSHEEFESGHRRLDQSHALQFPRHVTATVNVEALAINGKFGQEGRWTLTSFIDGEMVFQGDFNLIDCGGRLSDIVFPEFPEAIENPEPERVVTAEAQEEALATPEAGPTEPIKTEPNEEELVCRTEKLTGSHRKSMICRPLTRTERRRRHDQDMIRDVQRTPGGNVPQ